MSSRTTTSGPTEPVHLYGPDGRALLPTEPGGSESQSSSTRRDRGNADGPPAGHRDGGRPTIAERVRERVDHFFEVTEAAGVQAHGVRTFLYLWRRLGLKGLVPILLLVGFPIGEYSLLSHAVNATVPALANDFGVTFEADEWSYHPFSLTAVARGVRIRPEHPNQAPPVFTAAEVMFEGNLSSTWTGLKELAASSRELLSLRLPHFHTFNEITIKHGELRLDRSLAGNLNWTELADQVPEEKMTGLMRGLYQVNAISVEDLRFSYVEHIPGNSGGGIIESAQASIYVDDITGAITNIRPVTATDQIRAVRADGSVPMPTKYHFSGRSADGTIDVVGGLGLVGRSGGNGAPDRQPEIRYASLGDTSAEAVSPGSDGPYFALTVHLDNIGVAAFYRRMTLPMRVIPSSGTVHGRLVLRSPHASRPACPDSVFETTQVEMRDVRYTPNPQMVFDRGQFESIKRAYDTMPPVSKSFNPCESSAPPGNHDPGPGSPHPGIGPRRPGATPTTVLTNIVLSFNTQANENPPPAVRAALSADEQSLTGKMTTAAVEDVTSRLGAQLGQSVTKALGPKTGHLVGESVKSAPQDDNAISKGAKSVGHGVSHGLKRLFGREKPH